MVNNSTEPLIIKDAVASIWELHSAKWFDRYGWVDDHTQGMWGEKICTGYGSDLSVTSGTDEDVKS